MAISRKVVTTTLNIVRLIDFISFSQYLNPIMLTEHREDKGDFHWDSDTDDNNIRLP